MSAKKKPSDQYRYFRRKGRSNYRPRKSRPETAKDRAKAAGQSRSLGGGSGGSGGDGFMARYRPNPDFFKCLKADREAVGPDIRFGVVQKGIFRASIILRCPLKFRSGLECWLADIAAARSPNEFAAICRDFYRGFNGFWEHPKTEPNWHAVTSLGMSIEVRGEFAEFVLANHFSRSRLDIMAVPILKLTGPCCWPTSEKDFL